MPDLMRLGATGLSSILTLMKNGSDSKAPWYASAGRTPVTPLVFTFRYWRGLKLPLVSKAAIRTDLFIAHVMHDGSHPDLVTNRNDTRNVIRTAALNKIRLEDRRGQEHIKIATEYGKGQVSVGYLVDAEGKSAGKVWRLAPTTGWRCVLRKA